MKIYLKKTGRFIRQNSTKILIIIFFITIAITTVGILAYQGRHEILRRVEGLPEFTSSAGESFDEMVSMQDGVKLYTSIQLPSGDGPFPTVLMRSPYQDVSAVTRNLICGRFVRYGYACVVQDARGQGKSEGQWNPGVNNEIADGENTLNWLIEQDFQDGNIAMVGSSFLASVQYSALIDGAPAELKTIVPAMISTDIREIMYQDGMFRHETYTAWASHMRTSNDSQANSNAGQQYQDALLYKPHNQIDTEVYGVEMSWYQEMLAATSPNSDYWQEENRVKMRELPENIEIPILMIGGWYDVFFGSQFEDWQRLATQSESRYVIGPWDHSGRTGELNTPDAGGRTFQWDEMLPWLEHHLKGAPLTQSTGLRYYVMGSEGEWVETAEWPNSNRNKTKTFYLKNLENSNDCQSGELASTPNKTSTQISYTYDPNNPVTTRGGSGMLAYNLRGYNGIKPGTADQTGLCDREDVLTFQTDELEDGMLISGDITVKLDVSSSAKDTAFTAKLIEVFEDGREINIRDNITSLAFRNGSEVPLEYSPGEQVEITIEIWPIAWEVQPGSKLRLDVSSSDFPKFHAHSNIAGPWAEQTEVTIAEQIIYGGNVTLQVEK